MSESMIERVAKIIACRTWKLYCEGQSGISGEEIGEPPDHFLEDELETARAAVEAMREPNVDMMDSACAAWVKLYPAFEGEKPQPKAGEVATTIFNAMIDTALTPAKADEAG